MRNLFDPSSVFYASQDSDGDKSEDNLVVDVSNEVSSLCIISMILDVLVIKVAEITSFYINNGSHSYMYVEWVAHRDEPTE